MYIGGSSDNIEMIILFVVLHLCIYILLAIIYTEIKLSMAKYISPVRLQVDWCLPKYSVFEIRRGHGFKVQTTGRGNNW